MPVNKVRRRGSYAPLSAHYSKDVAVIEAGEKAELLYVRGLAFCADVLSDGFISDVQLPHVAVGLTAVPARARRLVEVGLWERVRGGYLIRSWLGWNKSRDDILADARKDSSRKAPASDDIPPPPEPPDDEAPEPVDHETDSSRNGHTEANGFRSETDRNPTASYAGDRAGLSARPPTPGQGRAVQNGGRSLGGSSGKQRGRDRTDPPRAEKPERRDSPCGLHPDDDRPCRRCRDRRLATEQANRDDHRASVVASLPARRCGMCDADGWLHRVGSALPVSPATRCDHETDHALQVARAEEAS